MAQGRMIVNAIAADKRINKLSDDTSRLAFTWLITFADCEGRTYGDPAVVRSMLFPRRQDVTIERMEDYIREWALLGLVVWYESDGDIWISFPKFDKNQPGLRKDREAASRIPQAPELSEDLLRSYSGATPELLPVKLKEVKGIEVKEPTATISDEMIYRNVTNHACIPGGADAGNLLEIIHKTRLVNDNDPNKTCDYLRPFWKAFKERYPNSTNSFWLTDWAVTGVIPNGKPKEIRRRKPVESD
jgi:hypothetical protein